MFHYERVSNNGRLDCRPKAAQLYGIKKSRVAVAISVYSFYISQRD